MGNRVFYPNGKHYYGLYTLHLFYKESMECTDCAHYQKTDFGWICYKRCDHDHSGWQPKESVKENKHPIVIEYQDLGDTVKILKIEGVMTVDEIKNHVGKKVLDDYFDGVHMSMNKGFLNVKDKDGYYMTVESSSNISKKAFNNLIETMKLASKRLASLIKESKPKIERIEI
jgi:hypothetical protein